MSDQAALSPVEDRLADRLEAAPGAGPLRHGLARALHRLGAADRAAYQAVARIPTPYLDTPLRRLSRFANFSRPWFLVAALLAVFGGRRGRVAALTGVAAIGAASLVVNQPLKLAGSRRRPDRDAAQVPAERRVRMPTSTSFPSGHSASAAAFAVAVGDMLPGVRLPLRLAAGVVAFSRVYTGVHYPGDVVVGATVGASLGRLTSRAVLTWRRRHGGGEP